MIILVSAVIAVLSAQSAFAQQRENTPFNTANGRTTIAPAAPRIFTVTTPGGGAAANATGASPAPMMTAGMINGAPSDGGRAFLGGGGGRAFAARGSSGQGVRRGGKAFWTGGGRRADGGGTAPTSTEEAPPNFSKPGALIRTTGQLPKYEKAEDVRTTTVNAGEIVVSDSKGFDVGRAPSIQQGPKDTLPPPNPTTSGKTSTGGAAANNAAY